MILAELKAMKLALERVGNVLKETREFALELAALAPKIKTRVFDFVKNGDEDIKYNIKKIPAIAIVGSSDYGIRYYGVPAGYEFPALVDVHFAFYASSR